MAFETSGFIRSCQSMLVLSLSHVFLKPNPSLFMPKSVKDQRLAINLPKFSRISSLEKFSMLKTHRGSAIGDEFIMVEKIVLILFIDQ
jgi:hypothetical protein